MGDSKPNDIALAVRKIIHTIPPNVTVLAAAKTRTLDEVEAVIQAGLVNIGYNYLQEAIPIIDSIGSRAKWHMIGHLQRNKAKKVAQYFDMVETVDSWRLAQSLESYCIEIGKVMSVLIEINSGREENKTGVLPDNVDELIKMMKSLEYLHVVGLMTMGPRFGNPEDARPYFKATREVFDRLAAKNWPNIDMRVLSMGMSNSYQIAIEEGANLVRIGTRIFGVREP